MMANPEPQKNTLFAEFARVGKALSNPIRLELLDLLCQAPRTVETLARLTGQSTATTSHHLQVLLAARLVSAVKKGLFVTYSPAGDDVCSLWLSLQDLAYNHLADLRRLAKAYLEENDVYQTVDRVTLMAQMRRGEVTLIDVRTVEEFQAGHIPGAVSVPLEKLEEMLPLLPGDRKIVTYCRGPFCILSLKAMKILYRHGRQVKRLPDGILQWQAAGLPLQVGAVK